MKDRYGADGDEDSSSSSESEDEKAEAVSSKLEIDFFKTMAYLKRNDPIIYNKQKTFFEDPNSSNDSEVCVKLVIVAAK